MFGLLERDTDCIVDAIRKFSEIREVKIFGSRALGNFKTGSDVDIALFGEKVDKKTVRRLSYELNEEYPLPYFFDVVNYNEISNSELKNHIDNVGKTIYRGTN